MLFFESETSSLNFPGSNLSAIHRRAENSSESRYRRRPISLNSITAADTQSARDEAAPDAHFNSSFPKSPQKSPSFGQCTFSQLKKKERKKINIWFQYMWEPIDTLPGPPSPGLFLPFFPPSLANGKQKQW